MIEYLYETHLEVRNLEASIAFYEKLGLRLGIRSEENAFLWIGNSNTNMLGLWNVPEGEELTPQHFAFHVSLEDLLQSKEWLAERGIELLKNKGYETNEPVVHPWMPAASVYFLDLDGNKLEFISVLPDEPKRLGKRVYLSEWNAIKDRAE